MADFKRLFFALEIAAPWPQDLPQGRCLFEADRHLTLAFLGITDFSRIHSLLPSLPSPPSMGLAGVFDSCLFLPLRHPHVVAWHIDWWDPSQALQEFQTKLIEWLGFHKIHCDMREREFLPHVTICRQPFLARKWDQAFRPLPMMTSHFHLYESLGHSRYQPVWSYPIVAPFTEIEHTADIAFHIHGHTFEDLYRHAKIALAFKSPSFLPYLSGTLLHVSCIEEIVMDLNMRIGQADAEIGSPFKAVSFHDTLMENNQMLTWQMIIDV